MKTSPRQRERDSRCFSCGRRDFVPAVDNDGRQYMGCKWCTVVIPPELEQMLKERFARIRGRR